MAGRADVGRGGHSGYDPALTPWADDLWDDFSEIDVPEDDLTQLPEVDEEFFGEFPVEPYMLLNDADVHPPAEEHYGQLSSEQSPAPLLIGAYDASGAEDLFGSPAAPALAIPAGQLQAPQLTGNYGAFAAGPLVGMPAAPAPAIPAARVQAPQSAVGYAALNHEVPFGRLTEPTLFVPSARMQARLAGGAYGTFAAGQPSEMPAVPAPATPAAQELPGNNGGAYRRSAPVHSPQRTSRQSRQSQPREGRIEKSKRPGAVPGWNPAFRMHKSRCQARTQADTIEILGRDPNPSEWECREDCPLRNDQRFQDKWRTEHETWVVAKDGHRNALNEDGDPMETDGWNPGMVRQLFQTFYSDNRGERSKKWNDGKGKAPNARE